MHKTVMRQLFTIAGRQGEEAARGSGEEEGKPATSGRGECYVEREVPEGGWSWWKNDSCPDRRCASERAAATGEAGSQARRQVQVEDIDNTFIRINIKL